MDDIVDYCAKLLGCPRPSVELEDAQTALAAAYIKAEMAKRQWKVQVNEYDMLMLMWVGEGEPPTKKGTKWYAFDSTQFTSESEAIIKASIEALELGK